MESGWVGERSESAREEGLFAGASSGANVIAAIRTGREPGPDAHVVALMVDSGSTCLSTDVYRQPMNEQPTG